VDKIMKIFLDMIGCRLNQSELEIMARQFTAAGHKLVSDPGDADLAVVNTCTVTAAAAADSRKTIRRIARSGVDQIIAIRLSLQDAGAAFSPIKPGNYRE
jgi:threonylcarbamoyladenosine tRNA methylthiotransferase MtaB